MFNGFKMSSFRCKSHVQEIILRKNMFGCPLKLILGFLGIFYVFSYKPKYSYTIMYECENSPLSHELFQIELFNFSHLNLFQINVFVKSSLTKILKFFFVFFGYPNHEPFWLFCHKCGVWLKLGITYVTMQGCSFYVHYMCILGFHRAKTMCQFSFACVESLVFTIYGKIQECGGETCNI